MKFDIEEAVCFTGHRALKEDINISVIDETIENLIARKFRVFLCGMAVGFDLLCFERVLILKEKYEDIKILACVPCPMQNLKYGEKEKIKYYDLLKKADEVILISPYFTPYCMKERDRFMVDNSSVCVSYLYKSSGGTYYTTRYAVEKGKEIIYIK